MILWPQVSESPSCFRQSNYMSVHNRVCKCSKNLNNPNHKQRPWAPHTYFLMKFRFFFHYQNWNFIKNNGVSYSETIDHIEFILEAVKEIQNLFVGIVWIVETFPSGCVNYLWFNHISNSLNAKIYTKLWSRLWSNPRRNPAFLFLHMSEKPCCFYFNLYIFHPFCVFQVQSDSCSFRGKSILFGRFDVDRIKSWICNNSSK